MLDGHTHSEYSFDSQATLEGFIGRATENNFSYLAVTDHFDPDFAACYEEKIAKGLNAHEGNKIDLVEYNERLKYYQRYAKGKGLDFARGVEIAWHPGEKPWLKTLPDFDVIVNSVHLVDTYCPIRNTELFFAGGVERAMERYARTVLASMEFDADWCVLAHFGYPSRFVPEGEKIMRYSLCKDAFDAVLAEVVRRDKALEFNTKVNNDPALFKRYYELGGRKISFGADAHAVELIGNKYDEAVRILSQIGFDHWTMYKNLKPVRYEF